MNIAAFSAITDVFKCGGTVSLNDGDVTIQYWDEDIHWIINVYDTFIGVHRFKDHKRRSHMRHWIPRDEAIVWACHFICKQAVIPELYEEPGSRIQRAEKRQERRNNNGRLS